MTVTAKDITALSRQIVWVEAAQWAFGQAVAAGLSTPRGAAMYEAYNEFMGRWLEEQKARLTTIDKDQT